MMLAASHMASVMTAISVIVRPLPRAETKLSTFRTSMACERRGYGAARRDRSISDQGAGRGRPIPSLRCLAVTRLPRQGQAKSIRKALIAKRLWKGRAVEEPRRKSGRSVAGRKDEGNSAFA